MPKQALVERLLSLGPGHGVGDTVQLERSTEGAGPVPAINAADAARVLEMLRDFDGEAVFVEEQDHDYYVVHLDSDEHVDGSKWVRVMDSSPLFHFLRQRHHAAGAGW